MTIIIVCDDCGQDFRPIPGPRGAIPIRCPECLSRRELGKVGRRPFGPLPRPAPRVNLKVRLCRRCGRPATSSRHWLCDACRPIVTSRTDRRTRRQRGYDAKYDAARKLWEPKVARGGVACGWCGRLIEPGQPWDLSHPGDDKAQIPVPWHRAENRRYANARRNAQRRAR